MKKGKGERIQAGVIKEGIKEHVGQDHIDRKKQPSFSVPTLNHG